MTTIAERTKFPQVLLIEDNQGDAILVQRAFKKAAIPGNVTIAPTAEIGLSILRREGGFANARFPDLILLDINLPYMGGSEFLELIKADSVLRFIPVIVMSSSQAELDLIATYKAYANGFITKPAKLEEYDHVIDTIEEYWFQLNQTLETPAATSAERPVARNASDTTTSVIRRPT